MILSLDIAIKTGWAFGSKENLIFGTIDLSGRAGDVARVGRHLNLWLSKTIKERRPSILVIERPWFIQGETNGFSLANWVYEAHRVAEEIDLPRIEYGATETKKFMTGDGRAKKHQVVEAVRKKGYKVTNDNEADAVALLLLHADKAGKIA